MRKVIFQYWIPRRVQPRQDIPTKVEDVPGTNCFSEFQSGYFHGWGNEVHEDATTFVMDSIAIVEHCATGHVHTVAPGKMRFVIPPENADAMFIDREAKVEITNVEKIGDKILDLLLPVLESINKKLDTL